MKTGLMVLAHGSKVAETDMIMTKYMEAIAPKVAFEHVEKAYLQLMEPDMNQAVASLYSAGVRKVLVFPFFLFNGNHIKEDIPMALDQLKQQYTDLEFVFMDNIGFDEKLVDLVVERIAKA